MTELYVCDSVLFIVPVSAHLEFRGRFDGTIETRHEKHSEIIYMYLVQQYDWSITAIYTCDTTAVTCQRWSWEYEQKINKYFVRVKVLLFFISVHHVQKEALPLVVPTRHGTYWNYFYCRPIFIHSNGTFTEWILPFVVVIVWLEISLFLPLLHGLS